MSKTLVAYFSASGVTAGKAKKLADKLGADICEIRPVTEYSNADLDWLNKRSRSTVEMNDPESRPEIQELDHDLSGYEEIHIGFPIWWYTAPRIINTFLESADFTGKKIHLFATSGGSGIDRAVKDLKAQYPELDIEDGKMMR
jgi:flavodoxin